MKISAEDALDIVYEYNNVVRNRIVNHNRWSVTHEVIFRHDGKLYRMNYSEGATEHQDESPFDDVEEVECVEVKEVPSIDYEDV